MDVHALSVAVRWLHVAWMAIALGGAVLLAVAARSRDRPLARSERRRLSRRWSPPGERQAPHPV